MKPTVDILLAVYNGEKYLCEQLASIFAQTEKDFHLIIRDNCSTDKTSTLLRAWSERYPKQISVIYGDTNLGVVGNFSNLLERAKAPYIMLSDADDVWLPDKIEKTLKAIGNRTEPTLVHTDLTVTDAYLNVCHPSFWAATHLDGSRPLTFKRTLVENVVTGCTLMMNRSLLELVRPLPLDVPMHDAWVALVASAFGHVVPIAEPTILYRQHGQNDSGATRYGLRSYLKKLADPRKQKQIRETRQKRIRQGELFLERFGDRLTPAQKEDLDVFLKANRSFFPVKPYLLWKNGLLETGLWRKLYQIFWHPSCI